MIEPGTLLSRAGRRIPESLLDDPEQHVIVSIISRLASWRLFDRAHPRIRRWGVPALCAVLGIPSLLNPANSADIPAELALSLAFTIPLLWRERRPMPVFAATTAVSVLVLTLGTLNGADAARIVALYNVGRHDTPRRLSIALAITIAQLVMWATVFSNGGQLKHATRPEVVTLLAMITVTAFAGLGLAGRLVNAYITALEKERDQRARLAAATERARISRDMHDILGHTLAIIVGLADGAAGLTETKPQRAADTLRIIATSGRGALVELRRLLTVVDDERADASLAPQPGLADLEALLERVRIAGPTTTLHTDGDLTRLAPGLQLAAYRIIQEALTNTLKHAVPHTTVHVRIAANHNHVRVSVEDTGPRRTQKPGRMSSGQGLLGMRERAALYQGSLTAGPNTHGGWTVHALLLTIPPAARTERHPA